MKIPTRNVVIAEPHRSYTIIYPNLLCYFKNDCSKYMYAMLIYVDFVYSETDGWNEATPIFRSYRTASFSTVDWSRFSEP